jgi:predicted transcriptional regulator
MNNKTRYTMDLDKQLDDTLSDLAARKGTSKAEIIKRALATYNFISCQAPANSDRKFSITSSDGTVLTDIVIP